MFSLLKPEQKSKALPPFDGSFSPLKTQTQGFKQHLEGLHCFALRFYGEQIQPAFCGVLLLGTIFHSLKYIPSVVVGQKGWIVTILARFGTAAFFLVSIFYHTSLPKSEQTRLTATSTNSKA